MCTVSNMGSVLATIFILHDFQHDLEVTTTGHTNLRWHLEIGALNVRFRIQARTLHSSREEYEYACPSFAHAFRPSYALMARVNA